MEKMRLFLYLTLIIGMAVSIPIFAYAGQNQPLVADHTAVEQFGQIPDRWIETIKSDCRMYYGHTSHGSQLMVGMRRIEDKLGSLYEAANSNYRRVLPSEPDAFCILDYSDDPDSFYSNCSRYLNANPSINYAMFSWCSQAGYSDWQSYLNTYLSQMQSLELEYPNVTFIYMTGNAQGGSGTGYRRYQFNQAIRQFCIDNNKVLFDFADIDCWHNDEQDFYRYSGINVPIEHAQYSGNESCHTTYENCENKGRAVW